MTVEALKRILEKKEQELRKTKTLKFKLWFFGRLLLSYFKSILGFFIPNVVVVLIAGILVGVFAPTNVPAEWIKILPAGAALYIAFGGFILYLIHSICTDPNYKPIFLWAALAILFGIISAIPYLLRPSNDPSAFYLSYGIFTLIIVPSVFVLRRFLIIWGEIEPRVSLLTSEINRLRNEIAEKMNWIRKKEMFEETMRQKGLIKICRFNNECWGTPEQVKRYEEIESILENNFSSCSDRDFRKFIGELLKKLGYENVVDYGSHFIAEKNSEKTLVIARRYSENILVGNKEVRTVIGSLPKDVHKAVFIVTSDFTEYAYEQARNSPIELYNRFKLKEMVEEAFLKPLLNEMLKFELGRLESTYTFNQNLYTFNLNAYRAEEQVQEWENINEALKDRFVEWHPRRFEEFIAELFRRMGYQVQLTSYSCDYGADILLEKDNGRTIVQVKKYYPEHLVDREEIIDILGALPYFHATKAIFITTSDFTDEARELERNRPIELWNFNTLKELIAKYFLRETSETTWEEKIKRCKKCGSEISEQEYEKYDGLCFTCWKLPENSHYDEVAREMRRAGLLGADRASTW